MVSLQLVPLKQLTTTEKSLQEAQDDYLAKVLTANAPADLSIAFHAPLYNPIHVLDSNYSISSYGSTDTRYEICKNVYDPDIGHNVKPHSRLNEPYHTPYYAGAASSSITPQGNGHTPAKELTMKTIDEEIDLFNRFLLSADNPLSEYFVLAASGINQESDGLSHA